jgi:hypothetical protein
MSQELDGGFCEATFVEACKVVVGAEDVKHDGKVFSVFGGIFGEDENVIEEYDDKVV